MSMPDLVGLKNYFERRLDRARNVTAGQPDLVDETFSALIRETLWLTERKLREMFGPHHYELSVFIDKRHPRIAAYYDSDQNYRPRSAAQRDENPNYYVDKNYEVVELFERRKGGIRIISDTLRNGYESTPEQRGKIGSTILYCFDNERPAALVATCSEHAEFMDDDDNLRELIRIIAIAIRADLELWSRLPLRAMAVRSTQQYLYSWLHISDLHFGANPQSHRFDQAAVCRAMIRDVEKHAPHIDAIFITGDIAFKAAREEFGHAAEWLKKLIEAADVNDDSVFIVPGNHDVDRKTADGARAMPYHNTYRNDPKKIESGLTDPDVRVVLMRQLEGFDRFLREHFPKHPRGSDGSCVDWYHVQDLDYGGRRLRLRLAGLSTVWVSDSFDGCRNSGAPDFFPNMTLAQQQLEATVANATDEEIVLLFTHHPPDWLLDSCRSHLFTYIANLRCIHFSGHIHRKEATVHQPLGERGAKIHYVAGAGHNEAAKCTTCGSFDTPRYGEHSYAWGALRWHEGSWHVGWAPRIYVRELDRMRADRNRYDLEEDGFAWQRAPWE